MKTIIATQTTSVVVATMWHCNVAVAGMGCSNSLVGKVM